MVSSILRRILKRNVSSFHQNWLSGDDLNSLNEFNSGKVVTEVAAFNCSVVYACTRVIAETISSLPLNLHQNVGENSSRIAREHPLHRLIHYMPNPEMTAMSFWETIMLQLLLWGNAYVDIVRDNAGRVKELWPLSPDRIRITRDTQTKKLIYEYSTNQGLVKLKKRNVLHIPGLSFDGIRGYSPIAVAREAVGLSLATEEYGARFFKNGARPGGVLEHPGIVKDVDRLRKSWEDAHRGGANAHKVAILEEGMKYTTIGVPPEDAQFLETRKFQVTEICRIFRVPPHLVGDLDRATFSNIEHQSIEFAVHTIRPWLVRIEQAIHKDLLREDERTDYFARFIMDGLLRGDYQSRMRGYSIGKQNGWLSANDIRALEDMNPIPKGQGGDIYMVNGNMKSTSEIIQGKGDDTAAKGIEKDEGGEP